MEKIDDPCDKILEMVEEGLLDKDTVILAFVKFCTQDQIRMMAKANDFF